MMEREAKEIFEKWMDCKDAYQSDSSCDGNCFSCEYYASAEEEKEAILLAISALEKQEAGGWIPVTERFPSKEERREWIDKNLGGVGYLYPCLVTRYSSINPDRTKNNPYVAKHYYDGEDFVNNGEEVCSEYIVAWRPLPEPYTEEEA